MKIEEEDNNIVNTQQAMDLEYYADGNNFDDIDMMEIDKDNKTTGSTAPSDSGLEKYANHGFIYKCPNSDIPAVGWCKVGMIRCKFTGVEIVTTSTDSTGFFHFLGDSIWMLEQEVLAIFTTGTACSISLYHLMLKLKEKLNPDTDWMNIASD